MIFFMCYLIMFMGMSFISVLLLLPGEFQAVMPPDLKVIAIVFGAVAMFVPMIYVQLRAVKTTVVHVLEPRKRGTHNWLYASGDSELMFTPGIRDIEKSSYSPELNAQIQEMKSYILGDHIIKVVREGLGHSEDLDMCIYAGVLKSKWGFESLKEARDSAFRILRKYKDVPSKAYFKNFKKEGEIDEP